MDAASRRDLGRHPGRAAAEADPVFRRFWDEGAKDEIPRAQAWLQQTGPAIIAQLTAATPGRRP